MKRKRFISIAAALCLALTAAPMGVLAQEEGEQALLEEIQEKPQEEIKEEIKEEPQEEIEPAEEEREEPQEEIEPAEEEKEEQQEEIKEEQQFSTFSFEENGIAVQAENADFIGEGTAENPYQIATVEDLRKLAEKVNSGESYEGKVFKQRADIDLSGSDWTPIGTNGTKPFKGTYDGGGKQIANLKITNGGSYIGLFGYILGNITNVPIIKNCYVTGEINGGTQSGTYVGGIVGHTAGAFIEKCVFKGKIEGKYYSVGGIAGLVSQDGPIKNCYAMADVTTSATGGNAGGIAGGATNYAGVENCYYSGNVSASQGNAGGVVGRFVGDVDHLNMKNCVSLAESVTGKTANRIAGYVDDVDSGKMSNNYAWNSTKVNGNTVSGGAESNANGENLTYTNGTLSKQFSEIFVEDNSAWKFENNKLPTLKNVGGTQFPELPAYITGTGLNGLGIKARPYLIQDAEDLAFMRDRVNAGDAHYASAYYRQTKDIDLNNEEWTPIGTYYSDNNNPPIDRPFKGTFDGGGKQIIKFNISNGQGANNCDYCGLFGYVTNATIRNCNISGKIKSTNDNSYAGGIVGDARDITIENCSFNGMIECNNGFIGGIAGYTSGGQSAIKRCYVVGTVKACSSAGGIAGAVNGTTIENCYALAEVTAIDSKAGGIAGAVVSGAAVKKCYHSGKVSASNYAGGIVGEFQNSTIQNCVALAESVTGNRIVGESGGTTKNNYAYNRTKLVTGAGENQTITYPTNGATNNENGADVYISKGRVVRDVASSESFWEELGFTEDNGWTVPNEPYALPYLWEGNKPMLAVDLTINETPQHFTTRNIGNGFVVTVTNEDIDIIEMNENIPFTKEYRLHGTDTWTETVPNTAGTYDVRITRAADGNINPFVCEINEGLILTRKRSSSSDDTAPSYTVQFDSNGGSTVAKGKTDANGKIEKPADPVKEGYLFAGWYSDSKLTKKFDFSAKPTANLTLYAKWSENKEIVLTIGSRTVSVFGSEVEYDVVPKIVNDRTMLPIRIVAESLGATVTWNGAQQRVTIQKGEDVILIVIGADTAYVNGEAVRLDAAAFVENGRTYLPLRFVSENLGAQVLWNETDKTVTIVKES